MRIKYIYQQLASHISVILIAFLIISLLFSQYVKEFVYDNKTDELVTYGTSLLQEIETTPFNQQSILHQYGNVLDKRDIQYSLFDESSKIVYSTGLKTPLIELQDSEWEELQNGHIITVKQSFDRFNQDVTFVLLPYIYNDQFLGGVLLTSPIKGSRDVVAKINSYLLYTTAIVLLFSLLLSWVLSTFHVKRIKRLQDATSQVASGDYSVRLNASNFDEISELAGDFNSMVEKLEQSMNEIESLESRRRQFMADVSHELRTPLTTIRGTIEGLKNDMIPFEERHKALELATNETRRLIRLVNENLDYEKIRSNQIELYKQDIQASELLEIIKEQLGLLAAEKHNSIVVNADPMTIVHADYDRLTQILINIIKNSIQFTDHGRITLRAYEDDKTVYIQIEDTGTGINAEDIEKIWSRFYKGIISRTSNPYGEFGLGLSIVKQLVMLHNGEVDVQSEHGKGTIFTIRFPKESTFSN